MQIEKTTKKFTWINQKNIINVTKASCEDFTNNKRLHRRPKQTIT